MADFNFFREFRHNIESLSEVNNDLIVKWAEVWQEEGIPVGTTNGWLLEIVVGLQVHKRINNVLKVTEKTYTWKNGDRVSSFRYWNLPDNKYYGLSLITQTSTYCKCIFGLAVILSMIQVLYFIINCTHLVGGAKIALLTQSVLA